MKILKRICLILTVVGALITNGNSGFAAGGDMTREQKNNSTQAYGFKIPEAGCLIYVDLDICMMFVYLDGKQYSTYPVSGGSPDNPSPTGIWRVTSIENWGEGFGGSWIGLSVPWGIYGIHGTLQPWALGEYNISHGCIRMHDEDVAVLKKLVSIGTLVYIKHDSLPFRALEHGMIGSDVMKTQEMLHHLRFYTGACDGIFGDGLEKAVRGFQKTYGLSLDGIVGQETYQKICEQNDIKAYDS